jgi:hypothetical protein
MRLKSAQEKTLSVQGASEYFEYVQVVSTIGTDVFRPRREFIFSFPYAPLDQ